MPREARARSSRRASARFRQARSIRSGRRSRCDTEYRPGRRMAARTKTAASILERTAAERYCRRTRARTALISALTPRSESVITQPRFTNITNALESITTTAIAPIKQRGRFEGRRQSQTPVAHAQNRHDQNGECEHQQASRYRPRDHPGRRAHVPEEVGVERTQALVARRCRCVTICEISGSASHGSSARNACPSHT